jgi:hypothetical protein
LHNDCQMALRKDKSIPAVSRSKLALRGLSLLDEERKLPLQAINVFATGFALFLLSEDWDANPLQRVEYDYAPHDFGRIAQRRNILVHEYNWGGSFSGTRIIELVNIPWDEYAQYDWRLVRGLTVTSRYIHFTERFVGNHSSHVRRYDYVHVLSENRTIWWRTDIPFDSSHISEPSNLDFTPQWLSGNFLFDIQPLSDEGARHQVEYAYIPALLEGALSTGEVRKTVGSDLVMQRECTLPIANYLEESTPLFDPRPSLVVPWGLLSANGENGVWFLCSSTKDMYDLNYAWQLRFDEDGLSILGFDLPYEDELIELGSLHIPADWTRTEESSKTVEVNIERDFWRRPRFFAHADRIALDYGMELWNVDEDDFRGLDYTCELVLFMVQNERLVPMRSFKGEFFPWQDIAICGDNIVRLLPASEPDFPQVAVLDLRSGSEYSFVPKINMPRL